MAFLGTFFPAAAAAAVDEMGEGVRRRAKSVG